MNKTRICITRENCIALISFIMQYRLEGIKLKTCSGKKVIDRITTGIFNFFFQRKKLKLVPLIFDRRFILFSFQQLTLFYILLFIPIKNTVSSEFEKNSASAEITFGEVDLDARSCEKQEKIWTKEEIYQIARQQAERDGVTLFNGRRKIDINIRQKACKIFIVFWPDFNGKSPPGSFLMYQISADNGDVSMVGR